jgi:hypothetical protein
MAKPPKITVWHVADQQNCFEVYRYAKRLMRLQEKSGLKPTLWSENFKEAESLLQQEPPAILHLHYHPEARKLRHVMRAAEQYAIPVVMTYHAVLRVADERRSHIDKCLKRTRAAFFLTEADRNAAIKMNPRLEKESVVTPIPPPDDIPEELPEVKHLQRQSYLKGEASQCTILYSDTIEPEQGIESLLDLSATFPEGMSLLIAGVVPPGEGKFAKYVKARVKYDHLPVELAISKRKFGHKQLCNVIARADFAYHPCGEVGAPDYGGAALDTMTIPYYNMMRLLTFSHPGKWTRQEPEVTQAVSLIDTPDDLVQAVQAQHANPERWDKALDNAQAFAKQVSWADLVKVTTARYKELLNS